MATPLNNPFYVLAAFVFCAFSQGAMTSTVYGSDLRSHCADMFASKSNAVVLPEIKKYEAFRTLKLKAETPIANFRAQTGITVTERVNGKATRVRLRVLSGNIKNNIQVYGDFNNWNRATAIQLSPESDGFYFSAEINGLSHGSHYRLIVNGEDLIDPSANMFATREINHRFGRADGFLNSIFWDIEGEGRPKKRVAPPDLRGKPIALGEQGLFELVRKWPYKNQVGPDRPENTYKFIAESQIIPYLKTLGYNAFEFLPFNESLDGNSWHYRYQVFGLFAPTSRYGTPTEFAEMIAKFNENEILVIMDTVIGHYPFQGNEDQRALGAVGLHKWKSANGQNLFGSKMSPWGTYRYDYLNPSVRTFLIDSIITMMRNYGIGGVRFDNYDGIRFEPGGELFLKELAVAIRKYRPEAFAIAEMFFSESQVTAALDQNGYGVNARTHSDFFDFIKDYAQKPTEQINMERLKSALRTPWNINEAARLTYVTNHDEAANRRDGATGSYLSTLIAGGEYYTINKIRAFASLAMLSGSYYMDMPQLRLNQEGDFTHNASTDWSLRTAPQSKNLMTYFSELTRYFTGERAFAFENQHANIENHIDDVNKVISLSRIDHTTGKRIYVLINLGHQGHDHYRFGIDVKGALKLALTSDALKFGGKGDVDKTVPGGIIQSSPQGDHGKANSLTVPYLPPYGILIFEH